MGAHRYVVAGAVLLGVGALVVALMPSPEAPGAPTAPSPAAPPPPTPSGFPGEDIPKIDVHVHFGLDEANRALAIMREQGIAVALNASGGVPGSGIERSMEIARETGNRIRPYCNVSFRDVTAPDFAERARAAIRECKELGAVGIKIFKSLGLGITLPDGSLLAVDDPLVDAVFETAAETGLPILIHAGDPQAFFRPPTPDNERFDELSAHPSWSFYGDRPPPRGAPLDAPSPGRWPSWEAIYQQFERRVARHPRANFLGAHFGNAPEEPGIVARMLDTYPNFFVETGARIPEIGRRSPAQMKRIFERHQDRILFGTDLAVTEDGLTLGSSGEDPDPPERVPAFFGAHWRYFETDQRGFAHPTPIQGNWTIDGIGLSRPILEKLYWRNAARLFGITLPEPVEN